MQVNKKFFSLEMSDWWEDFKASFSNPKGSPGLTNILFWFVFEVLLKILLLIIFLTLSGFSFIKNPRGFLEKEKN